MPDRDRQNIQDDIIRQSMQMAEQNMAEAREGEAETDGGFTDKLVGIMDNYIKRDEDAFQIMAELFDLVAVQTLSILDSLVDSITISKKTDKRQRQKEEKEPEEKTEEDEESFEDFVQGVAAGVGEKLMALKEFTVQAVSFVKGKITADALRQEAEKVEESLKAGEGEEEVQKSEEEQKTEESQRLRTEQEIQANEAVNEFAKKLGGHQEPEEVQQLAQSDTQRSEAQESILNETKNAVRINHFAEEVKAARKDDMEMMAAFAAALVNSPDKVMDSYLEGPEAFIKVLGNEAEQKEESGQEISGSDAKPSSADQIEMDAGVAMAALAAKGMEQLSYIFENSDDIERGILAGGMLQHMNMVVERNPELGAAMGKLELYQKNQMKYKGEGYMGSTMAQGREALRSLALNPEQMSGGQAGDIMMGQQMELLYVGSKGKGVLSQEAEKRGGMTPEKEQRERNFLSQTRMGSRLMSKEGRGEVLSQMADLKTRVQAAKETSQQAGKRARKYARHMDMIKEFHQMNAADRGKFLEEQRRKMMEKKKQEQEKERRIKTCRI